jgi:hypothetical protein
MVWQNFVRLGHEAAQHGTGVVQVEIYIGAREMHEPGPRRMQSFILTFSNALIKVRIDFHCIQIQRIHVGISCSFNVSHKMLIRNIIYVTVTPVRLVED